MTEVEIVTIPHAKDSNLGSILVIPSLVSTQRDSATYFM